jgi:hypothetical protein
MQALRVLWVFWTTLRNHCHLGKIIKAEWINKWMNKWMNEWMNEWMNNVFVVAVVVLYLTFIVLVIHIIVCQNVSKQD